MTSERVLAWRCVEHDHISVDSPCPVCTVTEAEDGPPSSNSGEFEACEATELEAAVQENSRLRNELSEALTLLNQVKSELKLTKKELESALKLANAGEGSEYVVKSLLEDWWLTPAGMQQLAPENAMRFKSRAEAEKNKADYMKGTPGWKLALTVEPE